MRHLDFRVSYNSILFNFVDSLSKWDYFVAEHIRTYFERHYGLNSDDQKVLDQYVKIRKQFEWEREMELFDWAYAGFPAHEFFSLLEPAFRHFEQKTDIHGVALRVELERAEVLIRTASLEAKKKFMGLGVETIVQQFSPLFKCSEKTGVLPCYITYTPMEYQSSGGANGDGVYAQMFVGSDLGPQVNRVVRIVSHEYMHKELNPGRYFEYHPDVAKREKYNAKYPDIYPDEYYQFVEEVVVYSINDVLVFGSNPEQKRKGYEAKYQDGEIQRKHFVFLWQAIGDVAKILSDFRADAASAEETLAKVDDCLLDFVLKNTK